jgi:3-phosphoshikimate 1-carboxyvinyltransferase
LFASLAHGRSVISNPLHSADAEACVAACRNFGAQVDTSDDDWIVDGLAGKILPAETVIDTLNSGTTLYLTASIAALADGWTFFTGDHQIRRRPAEKLLNALLLVGARAFSSRGDGCAPFAVCGPWKGGLVRLESPTSQYLSSLLIAAPLAEAGITTEIEVLLLNEVPYAEMTLKWLDSQGVKYERNGWEWFRIPGGQRYSSFSRRVPGDWSSATFFLVAALVARSRLVLRGLDYDDSQGDKKVVDFLRQMGAKITLEPDPLGGHVVTVEANHLHGAELDLNFTPDALPALAVLACYAEGETRLVNVAHARLKETDRISVMATELKKMGADVEERNDGLVIRGGKPLHGTLVDGHHDHRVVMSLALAALGATGATEIDTAEAAAVTFPAFFDLLEGLSKPTP